MLNTGAWAAAGAQSRWAAWNAATPASVAVRSTAADGQRVHQDGHAPFAACHPAASRRCRRACARCAWAARWRGLTTLEEVLRNFPTWAALVLRGVSSGPAVKSTGLHSRASVPPHQWKRRCGAAMHAHQSQRDFWSGLMFLIVGVAFAVGSLDYSSGTSARPGPGYSRSAWACCRRCWRCRAVQVTHHRDRGGDPHRCRGLETAAHHRGGHRGVWLLLPRLAWC